MVNKEYIFRFLRDLSDNNSKEWMDANRERYHTAKERWLYEVELILERLVEHDIYFKKFKPKDTIMRINNNRQFHQDRPVYKDYFGCTPTLKEDPISRLHISAGLSWSFIGGGLWRPEKDVLDKVRDAIDYEGEKLLDIINEKKFQEFFGGLGEDSEKLKTSPQDYSKDHKFIDLLRYKSLTARVTLTQKTVVSDGFVDFVEEAYLTLKPFTTFLEKAIST